MKGRQKNNAGVTLIELLVVIAIMMTLLTLVAPVAINSIDRVKAQDEYLEFCMIIRKASLNAFVNHEVVFIEMNEKKIVIRAGSPSDIANSEELYDEKEFIEKNFEHLLFSTQIVSFNRNGIPDTDVIEFRQKNMTKKVSVLGLLKH